MMAGLILLHIFLFISNVYPENTLCRDGWMAFYGSCYLFANRVVDFTEAEQYCRMTDGAHLVHVDDMVEEAFIRDRLSEFKPNMWWLGCTDEDIEGYWKWTETGEFVWKNQTDWYIGQPNGDGDCAVFNSALDFRWTDTDCTNTHYPVCEISVQ